jgi:hypothetical protein
MSASSPSLSLLPSCFRYSYHLECKRQGALLSKAAGRMKNLKMYQAWNKWFDIIREKREQQQKQGRRV